MHRAIAIIFLSLFIISCGAKKKASKYSSSTTTKETTFDPPKDDRLIKVAENALKFQGTKYKYGGTTKKGMDCSGLVYTSFLEEDIALPRVSRDMAREGKEIKPNDVNIGDLLFFKTGKSARNINHVGLVVDIMPGQILFIHSTTSRGVIVSSLNEGYWNNAFVEARRIL